MRTLIRKDGKTAAMVASGQIGGNPLFLADYLLSFFRVAVLLAIWRMIYAGKGPLSGMSVESVLTYTLIAGVFWEQLGCRTNLGDMIEDGSIATRYLRPVGIFRQCIVEAAGGWWLRLCLFSIPLLLIAPLLGVNPRPASATAGALFAVSLVLAISVGMALEFLFAAMMVSLENSVYAVNQVRNAVEVVLSGSLLPLALLPWGLGSLFEWLPFAAMGSAPLRIYTATGEPGRLIALQLGWSLILWPLASWLWRLNRERMVCYGG